MPNQDVSVATPLTAEGDFNVSITTSECETTTLALLAKLHPVDGDSPIHVLPIRKNGTTRCRLDPDHYAFSLGFENVDGPASVTIEVKTGLDPSTAPNPLPSPGAGTGEKGSMTFDVFV